MLRLSPHFAPNPIRAAGIRAACNSSWRPGLAFPSPLGSSSPCLQGLGVKNKTVQRGGGRRWRRRHRPLSPPTARGAPRADFQINAARETRRKCKSPREEEPVGRFASLRAALVASLRPHPARRGRPEQVSPTQRGGQKESEGLEKPQCANKPR